MAIKYKFLKQSKKGTEVIELKDKIIQKTGHSTFFTLEIMEFNEAQLQKTKAVIENTIAPVILWLEENKVDEDEKTQNTIMMYREAEILHTGYSQRLVDNETAEEKLTKEEVKETVSNIEHNHAIMENIKHFHPIVLDITSEEASKIANYRKTKLQLKEYEDKLEEINSTLKTSEVEKAEIYKQLQII